MTGSLDRMHYKGSIRTCCHALARAPALINPLLFYAADSLATVFLPSLEIEGGVICDFSGDGGVLAVTAQRFNRLIFESSSRFALVLFVALWHEVILRSKER
jgi:hypothetical protein